MNNLIDVAGCWRGIATSGAAVFHYHWCLEQDGEDVVGVISLSMPDGSRPGSYRMRGLVRGNTLRFEGTEFIRNPGNWCLAAGHLQYAIAADGRAEMRGYWGPLDVPGGCPPGSRGGVILRRS